MASIRSKHNNLLNYFICNHNPPRSEEHTSENWAERVASKDDEKDILEEDGCNKVFCPKCKYEHYYCK